MSTFSFLGRMGIAKAGKLGDAFTTALVSFDPESATEAQIQQMLAHVNELAARVATAETQAQKDGNEVSTLQASFDRTNQAATILSTRLESTTDEAAKAKINENLNTIVDTLEKVTSDLTAAKAHAKQSADDVVEWKQVHQQAVTSLGTARQKLDEAKRDMQHAQQDEQREKERQIQAQRDAGLRTGIDTGAIGLSAMEKAASDAREHARAAALTTEAMKHSNGGGAEDIVAEALASEAPAPSSAAERLAALRAKTG